MFLTSRMSLSFLSTNRPSKGGNRLSRQGPETRQHVVFRRIEGRRHSVHASSAVPRGRIGCDAIYDTHRYKYLYDLSVIHRRSWILTYRFSHKRFATHLVSTHVH